MAIGEKLGRLVELNRSRVDYLARFQALIYEYNAEPQNVQLFFAELLAFARELTEEERRAVALGLSEEELAVFDLLTRPEPDLTEAESEMVKTVARDLLATLKRGKFTLDWRRRPRSKARVRRTIVDALDDGLPVTYSDEARDEKSDALYQHVYDAYWGKARGCTRRFGMDR